MPNDRLRARVTLAIEGASSRAPAQAVRDALAPAEDRAGQHQPRVVEVEDVEVLSSETPALPDVALATDFYQRADLRALAAQQGVSRVRDVESLLGDFWPVDEEPDEFIAAVRVWRRDAV